MPAEALATDAHDHEASDLDLLLHGQRGQHLHDVSQTWPPSASQRPFSRKAPPDLAISVELQKNADPTPLADFSASLWFERDRLVDARQLKLKTDMR